MVVIELALFIVAFILLVLAASDRFTSPWNLGWLGLAFFVAGVLLPKLLPAL